ncbi:hypothetical protein BLNAU_18586 [Blattamonas nauphoetae]|uniref:Transposase n=1 Tax=Blattamonas nauphoetae TaxID=2049346 RepID=A0ABQ9X760_9EUKA|nr:hypothetical protein BLNAU_18586 [Blattamonas nauphoetae]
MTVERVNHHWSQDERTEMVRLMSRYDKPAEARSHWSGSIVPDVRTFSQVFDKFTETGKVDDRPRSGRPRTSCSDESLKKMKDAIETNPTDSERKHAANLQIPLSSLNRAQENPHYHVEVPNERIVSNCWIAMSSAGFIGPYFFSQTVTGPVYTEMLKSYLVPQLKERSRFEWAYFQQDGAPPHTAPDLISHLIITLNLQSLSFAETGDIHINLMAIIDNSLWLATPKDLFFLGIQGWDERQAVYETTLKQVLVPSEKYKYRQMMKKVRRMLRMEGIEDVIEEMLRRPPSDSFRFQCVDESIEMSNLHGMNVPEEE